MAIEIKAPTFPESVADGTVATWHKKVGEAVKRDELIVDIETDKVRPPPLRRLPRLPLPLRPPPAKTPSSRRPRASWPKRTASTRTASPAPARAVA